jgi:hypothetical protein
MDELFCLFPFSFFFFFIGTTLSDCASILLQLGAIIYSNPRSELLKLLYKGPMRVVGTRGSSTIRQEGDLLGTTRPHCQVSSTF